MDRGAWWATVYGVTTVGHDLASKPPHVEVGALQAWSYRKDSSLEFREWELVWPTVISWDFSSHLMSDSSVAQCRLLLDSLT